ncbi:MAG: glycosyltransferase family 2 protein [Lachnospiraceae bacterium]|nr:glycosyltransferase family 2 protein [Lachnospiraceae bacterium]
MDRILVFIPAYNCENQIVRVLSQFDEEVLKYVTGIIVVNNRSTDNTEMLAAAFIAQHRDIPIRLLRNRSNYGLGGSHKVAFDYAMNNGFDYVIVLHGDDQGSIKDFLPVLRSRYYRKHDCILGARFMKGSKLQGYSAFRTFGNIIYDFLFAFVVRKKIYDLGSGLNMYGVTMLKNRFYEKFPDNLMFNYCMILASDYYDHDIRFVPVSWREDDQVSNVKMMNQALRVLKMLKDYYRAPGVIKEDYRETAVDAYEADVIA